MQRPTKAEIDALAALLDERGIAEALFLLAAVLRRQARRNANVEDESREAA